MTTAKSAAQLVYDQLKKKIIDFEIYPGTRLTELEIAEEFAVSRTPVRAALQRLETEGQITILPKQGCFVRSVDIETISQITEGRAWYQLYHPAEDEVRDDILKRLEAAQYPVLVLLSVNTSFTMNVAPLPPLLVLFTCSPSAETLSFVFRSLVTDLRNVALMLPFIDSSYVSPIDIAPRDVVLAVTVRKPLKL